MLLFMVAGYLFVVVRSQGGIEGGVSMNPEPSKKKKSTSILSIDYTKCIVCQQYSVKPLCDITFSK